MEVADFNPEAYFGLSFDQALDLASEYNCSLRIFREDGRDKVLSRDYRTDRVNIELEDHRVIRAYLG